MSTNAAAMVAILNDILTLAANASRAANTITGELQAARAAGVDITDEQLAKARGARLAVIGELDAEIERRRGDG